MTTSTVQSVAKRDGCGDWLVVHLILLYGLVSSLFVAVVVVHISGRNQYAQIIDELDRLRNGYDDAVDLRQTWLLPNRPSKTDEASSVGILQRLSDGVETASAERRRRRDIVSSSSSSTVDTTMSSTAAGDDEVGDGSGEVLGQDGSQPSGWIHSKIPVHVLADICTTVKESCPTGRPGPPGVNVEKAPSYTSCGRKKDVYKLTVEKANGSFVQLTQREPGPPGLPGQSAIGIPGTKGDQGDKGERGSRGLPGEPGIKGDTGQSGAVGLAGTPGDKGDRGDPGIAGLPGPMGPPGEDGLNGTNGEKGDQGQPGLIGPPGPSALKDNCCNWLNETITHIKGEKGDQGVKGESGERGMEGAAGRRGEKGDRGQQGLRGVEGPAGFNGTDGQRGRRGKPGEKGSTGVTGSKGSKGDSGTKGEIGRGEKGEKGAVGPPGLALRPDNASGPYVGMRGLPGPPGLPGVKGSKGDPGYSCGCDFTTEEMTTEIPTTVEPTIEPRIFDCRIRAIGKPVFQNSTKTHFGMWLKDSHRFSPFADRLWVTKHFTGNKLLGYDGLDQLRRDQPSVIYELKELYFGTGNVIYNGSFYYHRAGYNEIIKYDLQRNETVARVVIYRAAYQSKDYLYSTEYNYFDMSVDENGLWVVYTQESDPDFLRVAKLNLDDLAVQKTWKIAADQPRAFGNGWVTCGVLYLVRDVFKDVTNITFAYDLYTQEELNITLRFHNPYHMNNMIAYNYLEKMIYSWDKGYLLTYPLLL